jgi:ribose transport system ATP-binding protein
VIRRGGRVVTIGSPKQAVRLGIGLLTEKRKLEGLVVDMSVKENVTLPSLARFGRAALFIDNTEEQYAAQSFIDKLNIVVRSASARVNTLSGGNQQKTILAKWLLRDPDILIFIAPTQGIDVGAKAEIYQHLNQLARDGKCIVVVSEEPLEILGVSDRIFVMYNGRLTTVLDRAEASEESLLSAIQGNELGK